MSQFLNKTFLRLRNGEIDIYSKKIVGDYFWDAADIVGEAFSEWADIVLGLIFYRVYTIVYLSSWLFLSERTLYLASSFTVLCKSNANEFWQNSWLFKEISLETIFQRNFPAFSQPLLFWSVRFFDPHFAWDAWLQVNTVKVHLTPKFFSLK